MDGVSATEEDVGVTQTNDSYAVENEKGAQKSKEETQKLEGAELFHQPAIMIKMAIMMR